MARYVILTLPTHGRIHPTAAVAHDLVARGHEVIYYVRPRFAATVAAAGALVRLYDVRIGPARDPFPGEGHSEAALTAHESHHLVPELVDQIGADSADCLVYDNAFLAARVVRQILGLPAIALHFTCPENEHTPRGPIVRQPVSQAGPDSPDRFPDPEPLNIVFLPREYQPAGNTFDERYVFVGPSIQVRPDDGTFPIERLDTDRPVIYFAPGPLLNERPGLLSACTAAFGERQWRVVVSGGGTPIRVDPGTCPDNVVVTRFAPQLEVLSRAAVFVTGCGTTSVMEGLYYGVPMLGVPRTVVQEMTARRIAELGTGISMDPLSVTASSLYEGVARLLAEPTFADNARQMQRCAHAAGGHRRAADVMIRFCRGVAVGR